ncbi:MANSC domain-containing protein 1 [Galemys pyrenaicus]|uniref:MANSC domain-containing protein 1 n=1 Tax=Galemys pyrenaicus TaxID=202257 RepID=A0A8J6AAN3_GALPY|nr:MANSC domain-containing protein 1 [Galemys pyrenaicus]
MFFRKEQGWTYTWVIICFLTLRLSASQKCPTESLGDAVIDIQTSLTRGIRGSEPLHASTQEDCVSSCCSTTNIAGDKACNLVIFDARKTTRQPNCYLFFCPSEDACPLKPAEGLRTYRIIREFVSSARTDARPAAGTPMPPPLGGLPEASDAFQGDALPGKFGSPHHLEKMLKMDDLSTRHPVREDNGHSPGPEPLPGRNPAPLLPGHVAALPTTVATAAPHRPSAASQPAALPSPGAAVAQPRGPGSAPPVTPAVTSQHQGSSSAPPVIPAVTSRPQGSSSAPPVTLAVTSQHQGSSSAPPVTPAVTSRPQGSSSAPPITPAVTSRPQGSSSAPPVSAVTFWPSATLVTTLWPRATATIQSRVTTTATPATTFQGPTDSKSPPGSEPFRGASSPPVSTGKPPEAAARPLPTAPHAVPSAEGKAASGAEGPVLRGPSGDSALDGRLGLPLEKGLLLGSLLFGVLFLAIGLVLLGRMLLESLRRRRYSRLDYLINGIYVDI